MELGEYAWKKTPIGAKWLTGGRLSQACSAHESGVGGHQVASGLRPAWWVGWPNSSLGRPRRQVVRLES